MDFYVHNVPNFEVSILKIAANDIEDYGRHGMPDMGAVVHRRTADVHTDPTGFQGFQFLFTACEGVVNLQGHQGFGSIQPASGLAKIIRPAAVCSTLVTVTGMVVLMFSLPPSITTIVPSSRYATP